MQVALTSVMYYTDRCNYAEYFLHLLVRIHTRCVYYKQSSEYEWDRIIGLREVRLSTWDVPACVDRMQEWRACRHHRYSSGKNAIGGQMFAIANRWISTGRVVESCLMEDGSLTYWKCCWEKWVDISCRQCQHVVEVTVHGGGQNEIAVSQHLKAPEKIATLAIPSSGWKRGQENGGKWKALTSGGWRVG